MPGARGLIDLLTRLGRYPLAVVFVLIALAVAYKTYNVANKPGSGIEIAHLIVASDLLAGMRRQVSPERAQHERMPGYATLLAATAMLDGNLAIGLACRDIKEAGCSKRNFASIVVVQYLLAVAMLGAALLLAWRLSGSRVVAALTLVLTFIATRPGDFAGIVSWGIWHQALLYAGTLAAVLAHQRLSPVWGLLAGAAFGAGAMLEPHVIVLVPVVAAVIVVAGSAGWGDRRRLATCGTVLAGGALATLCLSWLAMCLSYNPDGAVRYLLFRTAERLDYNGLDIKTWLVALVLPIPLIGDWLQGLVMSDEAARKFAMYVPGSLAHQSLLVTYPHFLSEGGSAARGLGLIVWQRVIEQPGLFVAALVPVFFRGAWASAGLVALLGVLHVRSMVRYATAERSGADLAVVVIPIVALLLLNTLLTANHYFLNPMLPFLFAYAIAYVSGGV